MANIYEQQSVPLHELLDKASSDRGATILIPDLQRPYVWSPNQVTLLVDSLIRGWPFGTLLMWKVGTGELQNIPHRQFWRVVDRTSLSDSLAGDRKDPPASFHMVLDGQQRVQSLLLALGGDGWGFRLEDRDWMQETADRRPRGRVGKYRHWSKASLCFDLDSFLAAYEVARNILAIDYRNVLSWVITDPSDGQSNWPKPANYEEALVKASAHAGRFVRLSRLWETAGQDGNVKEAQFRTKLATLFQDESIPAAKTSTVLFPLGELMTTLRDVKLSKVTYLELRAFNEELWSEDSYNDAIVNIFTRLNTAGRTLTREEITLAWLKVGWDSTKTRNNSAGECFEELLAELSERNLAVHIDDLVGAVSFIWGVSLNNGKLIDNRDLLKGDVIRPMASDLSERWAPIVKAFIAGIEAVNTRQLEYGASGHYASLNALTVIWAWYYLAISWQETNNLTEPQRDDFTKKCADSLALMLDRWLICSQWAGRWAQSSKKNIAAYAKELSEDCKNLQQTRSVDEAHRFLNDRLNALVQELEVDAAAHVTNLTAPSRERVAVYRTPLWVWHRLDATRWEMSKVQLRIKEKAKVYADVDHTVAFALWERRLLATGLPTGVADMEEGKQIINGLGNCILLEKSFNISKSDQPAKVFLDQIHEFKEKKRKVEDWAQALGISPVLLEPQNQKVDDVAAAINARDKTMRDQLVEFVKGSKSRVDV